MRHYPQALAPTEIHTEGEVGEIVAHVAINVFTNYFNNVAKTGIDFPEVNVSKAA